MSAKPDDERFTPRFPSLVAIAILTIWVTVLCLPMLSGNFLGGPQSDQTWTGIAFREFWAQEWHRTGHVPLWNPYMFGGLPFVAAMHGDTFYPTSFLRIVLNAAQTLNFVFWLHLVLAGVFTWVFLRTLRLSWTASVVGGLAYQLSGIIASQVSPGHDGKLVVSSLLPLLLTGLVLGIRRRRLEGYALVALTVGLDLLSPHLQTSQYSLILAGLFSLWLCFVDEERPAEPRQRWIALALATAAVALGFGLSMIQMLPFIGYGPYAARVAGSRGWEYATSYAMPPENILDWLVPTFTGTSLRETYWGSNYFKLHSEYVGAATLVLAIVGVAGSTHRKLVKFLVGAFVLFLLVSLGGHTPFYRLWYALVPGVKVTRAPGMAFFIPTFVFAVWAAMGVERLERGEGRKTLVGALVGAGVLLLLGASGALATIASNLASSFEAAASARDPRRVPDLVGAARANTNAIALGATWSAALVAATAGLGIAAGKGRIRGLALTGAVILLVSADGFINARRFFQWTPIPQLYADDEITRHLAATPAPYRAMDLPDRGVYRSAFLMVKRVPNAFGHHGNELNAYDALLGGKGDWLNLNRPTLWEMLAWRYVILPGAAQLPGYHPVDSTARAASSGQPGILYEADTVPPYARVVPAAVKAEEARIVPTLLDPRWNHNRIVILPEDAPVNPPRLDSVPPAMSARAAVTAWEPGAMTVRMEPTPEHDAYLVVSENWYPDWRATVDGRDAPVLRGQQSLITVPVARGAREVRLRFVSAAYPRGRAITLVSLGAIALWFVLPLVRRRRSG